MNAGFSNTHHGPSGKACGQPLEVGRNRRCRNRSRHSSGFSLPEFMISVFIFSTLLMGGAALMHISTVQFQDTVYNSYAETDLDLSIRKIRTELSQACSVTFQSGGMGVQYKLYALTSGGTIQLDSSGKPVMDATLHTLELRKPSANATRYSLYWDKAQGGLNGRPVIQNISLSDPNPETVGAVTYTPFAFETGSTNVIRMKLVVSQQYGTPGAGVRSSSQRMITDFTCRNL